ncbi:MULTISPECIES: hypothetical protein [Streptomyces]|uniref:LPXTG cell wall anchor domain-containing protein n=1 Tax=Streptomyces sudanensis TaxID=436397 RepID=A0ABY4TFP0_9ACTN|nr:MULTISPECIES: hypothetical protein [Streptomyces]URN15820.1 hypothetical protein MW084_07470 [Streptomyces sudanensis]
MPGAVRSAAVAVLMAVPPLAVSPVAVPPLVASPAAASPAAVPPLVASPATAPPAAASPPSEELPECIPWSQQVDHPDHDNEPDSVFDFAFLGAPEEIRPGSGPHAFRVRITDFDVTRPSRWDLDVVDVRNRARHVPEAKVQYADARGAWHTVTWEDLQDAPDFPVPGGRHLYDLALRVEVGAEARVEKAALIFSAAKEEMPIEWMPRCLDIARSNDPATTSAETERPRARAGGGREDTGPSAVGAALAAAAGAGLAALALRYARRRRGARNKGA